MLLQSRHGQQGRDCHVVLIHAPVRKNDNVHAVTIRPVYFHKEAVDGFFHAGSGVVNDGNHFYLKAFCLHIFYLHQVRIGENRIVNLQNVTVFRHLLQQVSIGSDVNSGTGNHFLTDGIDGRVGYLGKKLFEIVEQRMIAFAQHGNGRIHTHGGNGFGSVLCHRENAGFHFLVGVTKGFLKTLPFLVGQLRYPLVGNL